MSDEEFIRDLIANPPYLSKEKKDENIRIANLAAKMRDVKEMLDKCDPVQRYRDAISEQEKDDE